MNFCHVVLLCALIVVDSRPSFLYLKWCCFVVVVAFSVKDPRDDESVPGIVVLVFSFLD